LGINYFKIVSESVEIEGFKNTRSGTPLVVQLEKAETVRDGNLMPVLNQAGHKYASFSVLLA